MRSMALSSWAPWPQIHGEREGIKVC